MENEKRLIDANALKSEFEWLKSVVNESSKGEVMDVMQRIDNAPTVDAVEVVRCKDCISYEARPNCQYGYCWHWEYETGESPNMVDGDDYCSNGVRRERK